MKKILSILLAAVMMLSVLSLTVAADTTYSVAKDADGNPLNAKHINAQEWVEDGGKLMPKAGSFFNFLLFDDELATKRIEATYVINDNGGWDKDHRTGIVFAFTDHDGDLTIDEAVWAATDISYYWAFINDWGHVEVMEMGKFESWKGLSTNNKSLADLGIDVKEGVKLAAEWDNEGHIKIYANGQLVEDITDETPLTGDLYGLYSFAWGNGEATRRYDKYVTSFVAGKATKPETGDTTVIVSLIALVAAMGTGIVIGKKRSFN